MGPQGRFAALTNLRDPTQAEGTPWPKLLRAKSALAEALASEQEEALFSLLTDRKIAADTDLPQTGIALEFERLLSSAFICSASYGTRASTTRNQSTFNS